jgi:hypothetical protein
VVGGILVVANQPLKSVSSSMLAVQVQDPGWPQSGPSHCSWDSNADIAEVEASTTSGGLCSPTFCKRRGSPATPFVPIEGRRTTYGVKGERIGVDALY